MGGGKSSETTSTVAIPEELKLGAAKALSSGMDAASLEYSPNRGVTIAGQTDMQQAANQNYSDASNAFGLDAPRNANASLAPTETAANGIQGYSTGALYDDNLNASMTREQQQERQNILNGYSGMSDQINDMAGIPLVGAGGKGGSGSAGRPSPARAAPATFISSNGDSAEQRSVAAVNRGNLDNSWSTTSPTTGYTGLGDMFDGGGAGASGDTYSGLFSPISNRVDSLVSPKPATRTSAKAPSNYTSTSSSGGSSDKTSAAQRSLAAVKSGNVSSSSSKKKAGGK
tara:strand:+ start:12285 stop:13142 length:858 start_codon:yes stop_codon:yes gene_type:complete